MYKFDCGCEVPILDEKIKPEDGLPSLEIDWININHNCPAVWNLYKSGKTKGVFQLEKPLGQSWAKKVEPTSVEEISALIALIRPGVLKGIIDGKSMANHYVDRKHGEDYELFHEKAESAIGNTYGVMLYQEQTLAISKIFAGFNLAQADILRRGMGKKKADVMAALRNEFVEGCHKTGIISGPDATALFDVIEKSNRYSFNKCLSPSTVVDTKNGMKTLSDVNIGDFVLAPSSVNTNEYVEVLDKIDNGYKELYEITLESGKTIECTIDHKFLCEDNKVYKLSEILKNGLRIMCEDI